MSSPMSFVGRNKIVFNTSKEEVEQELPWEQDATLIFRSIDRNNDGVLDKDELIAHMKKEGMAHREANKLFDMIDETNDARVSLEEWNNGFQKFSAKMFEEHTATIKLQALTRGKKGRAVAAARQAYIDFKESSGLRSKSVTVEQLLMKEPRWKTKQTSQQWYQIANLEWYQWHTLTIMEHWLAKTFFLVMILANAAVIGIQADDDNPDNDGMWEGIEIFFVVFFSIELAIKAFALGVHFIGDSWNQFDSLVVGISIIDAIVRATASSSGQFNVTVMRLLRSLRVVRLVSFSEKLNLLVSAWLQALQSVFWVSVLLVLLVYMFAVLGHGLIGDSNYFTEDPDSKESAENYATLPKAVITLLQFMTMDNWMEASRPLGERSQWIWIFVLAWLALAAVGLLNLLSAIFIDSLTELSEDAVAAKKRALQEKRYELMKFIAESFCKFDDDNTGTLDLSEVNRLVKGIENTMSKELQYLGIDMEAVKGVILAADTNDDASVDFEEFIHGISSMDSEAVKKDTWKLEARLKKYEVAYKARCEETSKQLDSVEMELVGDVQRIEHEYDNWMEKTALPLLSRLETARKSAAAV